MKKIDLISGRLTSNMADKLHPLSAAMFSSAPFSFPSYGVIFVPGSEVARVVQVLFREGQECSHENSLSLPSSGSTPGDFLLLNNALNDI